MELNEGEHAKEANPGRPNTAFDGFVTSICRQIGAALEIPYELLVKNFNASYSASRAALLEAWKMFKMYRSWLETDFCQPIFEEWMSEAVAKGRISAPGFFSDPMIRKAYCGAEWNGPAQGLLILHLPIDKTKSPPEGSPCPVALVRGIAQAAEPLKAAPSRQSVAVVAGVRGLPLPNLKEIKKRLAFPTAMCYYDEAVLKR